ncbi:hypothetical protein CPT32_26990, partial [Rhizobium sophoriradicis]
PAMTLNHKIKDKGISARFRLALTDSRPQLYRPHRTSELSILFKTFIQNPTRFVVERQSG